MYIFILVELFFMHCGFCGGLFSYPHADAPSHSHPTTEIPLSLFLKSAFPIPQDVALIMDYKSQYNLQLQVPQ